MTYLFDLDDGPFKLIKNHQKDIEMRLDDERRKDLKIGDIIIFKNRTTKEEMKVSIINLYRYKTFKELYLKFPKERLGYKSNEIANFEDMYKYYPKEKIEKYGALGIEIKLMD